MFIHRHVSSETRKKNNIVKDETAINRANTFDVLILKGQNYGEGELAVGQDQLCFTGACMVILTLNKTRVHNALKIEVFVMI